MSENVSKFSNRLPEHIVPEFYKINLDINPSHKEYKGEVEIELQILKSTCIIILNGAELTINTATVMQHDKLIPLISTDKNLITNLIIFKLKHDLEIGAAILKINFENKITERMRGFYLTTYVDDDGHAREGLVTNFEPDDCSRALPCFDEPCFKAVFQVNINYYKNKTVLSNTNLINKINIKNVINDVNGENCEYACAVFEKTPKMATYLLAFAMGDFCACSEINPQGVKISVYAPINKIKYTAHALTAAGKFIDFYNNFFNINYILNKLDLIAIPDISIGAMENWGLITFREDLLLVNPIKTTNRGIKDVYLVIAHEIAHQWFGNLVTMRWWSDLWLNEGFANFAEYLAVGACFPELDIWKNFHVSNYASALELDSYVATHAIEVENTHPAELDEIFDHITYCKGASVINMMFNFVGRENVRIGLSDYMRRFKFLNVTTFDLWACLEAACDKPVSEFIGSFTRQVGYPVIKLDYDSAAVCAETAAASQICNKTCRLTQCRFLLNTSVNNLKTNWIIPIDIIFINNNEIKHNLDLVLKTEFIELEFPAITYEYFLINNNRYGFYRVLYNDNNFKNILKNYSSLNLANRFGLINDYYSFCRAKLIKTSQYLNLVTIIVENNEIDEEIWEIVSKSLNDIYCLMFYSKYSNSLNLIKKYCVKIMLPILKSFNVTYNDLKNKSPNTIKLVSILMSCLCKFHDETKNMLLYWFDKMIENKIEILPDFRICVYRACFTSMEYTKKVLEYFKSLKMTEEKVDVFYGMTSCTDKEVISTLYELAMNENVKAHDGRFAFSALPQSPFAHQIGWEYVMKHSKDITERFSVPFIVNRIFASSCAGFASTAKHEECLNFLKNCQHVKMNQNFEQALETILIRSQWLEKDQDDIFEWFQKNAE